MSREPDYTEVRRIVLSVLSACSHCNHPYDLDDFEVVGRHGGLWGLRAHCTACDAEVHVAAVVGDTSVDLTEGEALDWFESNEMPDEDEIEPVTVDDVLDMHEFLETFDGDFRALFSRRR